MVAMESTASYWKPVYNIMEQEGLAVMVVNAQHMKNVPGRKTDVKDSEWIADLLQHGLLAASYIPDRQQRELRELETYRKSLVSTYVSEKNRYQKILEGANIKLSGLVADINGKSAQALLDLVMSGQQLTHEKYQEMLENKQISKRLKATEEELIEAMEGCLSAVQISLLREVRKHITELKEHIRSVEEQIDGMLTEEQRKACELIESIPGIGHEAACAIISVIGTDMSRFPTSKHICSWGGLCPGNHISAGNKKTGRTNKGNKLLRTTLTICAHSAVKNTDTYYYALCKRISAKRGKKRAIIAVAHSMLSTIYTILKTGEIFKDPGSDYFDKKHKDQKIKNCVNKLQKLGCTVNLNPLTNEVELTKG
jgi:transposase